MKTRKFNTERVMYIGNRKDSEGIIHPAIGLQGEWLHSFGFRQDMLVTAEFSQGCVVFTAIGKGMELYRNLVRKVREQDNLCLIQVRNKRNHGKDFPLICVPDNYTEDYGFIPDDTLIIHGEKGHICVKRLE